MKTLLKGFGVLVLFACTWLLGFGWRDFEHLHAPNLSALQSLVGVNDAGSPSADEVFRTNYDRIRSDYARSLSPVTLKYAGMSGLMEATGDAHTTFLPPVSAKDFDETTQAQFGGVGASLLPDPLGAKADTVFEDGPAYGAGMRSGDLIIGVNGQTLAGIDIDKIVQKIRGPEGSTVRLTVMKPGQKKPEVMSIHRAMVTAPTVLSKFLTASDVGYLAVVGFDEPTAEQFDKELAKLEAHKGMKGLVIDLRGNPGGLLETARDMLSRWVEDKTVVTMKFREGSETASTYSGFLHKFDYPVVVLINEDTASAAEIFSGALHDYKLATLVGEHSYGKDSVQNVWKMLDGASAKITIAHYFLPTTPDIGRKEDVDGNYLSGGLQPDIKVDLPTDLPVTIGDPSKNDTQLEKAIEVIDSKQ